MTRVNLDPRECKEALARTTEPIIVDLETTGLRRWDQVVSAGLLVDDVAYLLWLIRDSRVVMPAASSRG